MCHKLGLEPSAAQTFLDLLNLLISFFSRTGSTVNIVHIPVHSKGADGLRQFFTESLPEHVDGHVSLVPRAAHSVPRTLHAVDIWFLVL